MEKEEKLVPITIMVTPQFKEACKKESKRLQYSNLSEMVRDKLRFCMPKNIGNPIK